eukprot:3763437-Rhodomonas_salina.1
MLCQFLLCQFHSPSTLVFNADASGMDGGAASNHAMLVELWQHRRRQTQSFKPEMYTLKSQVRSPNPRASTLNPRR